MSISESLDHQAFKLVSDSLIQKENARPELDAQLKLFFLAGFQRFNFAAQGNDHFLKRLKFLARNQV